MTRQDKELIQGGLLMVATLIEAFIIIYIFH